MSETPKWIVEAALEAMGDGAKSYLRGIDENGLEHGWCEASDLATIIAKHSPVEALVEALELAQWVTEMPNERPFCPECGNYRTYGHRDICKVGAALALARGEK